MRKFIRIKFKEWYHSKGTERENSDFSEYVVAKRKTKRSVAKAQQQKSLGDKLNTKEKQKPISRVAKQMAKERRGVNGINSMRNKDGSVVEPELVKRKRKEYMERLMNEKNTWDGIVEINVIEKPIECITEVEVENAVSAIKLGKQPGPTGVSRKCCVWVRNYWYIFPIYL